MKFYYDILQQSRENVLSVIKPLSNEQLNLIPKGFNNNIIWNVAHLLVTQQLLVHRLSNVDIHVTDNEIAQFRKGTKPERNYTASEIEDIKERLLSVVYDSYQDYESGKFKSFKEYTTSYGVTMKTTEEAIAFNNTHEGLHLGAILMLKKLV